MRRGVRLFQLAGVLLFQQAVTIALSGYNACFFFTHARRNPRRRLGATVLGFVNVALAGESLAFGLLPHLLFARHAVVVGQAIVTSLSLAVALVMAALALRHRLRRGR